MTDQTRQHPTPSQALDYWEHRYQTSPRPWTGRPNAILKRWAESLAPGTALDLGCAEGNSAVWLAAQGWRVTGADISATALARAAQHAADAGVTERTHFEQHDLERGFPAGQFDLVYALYLQSPVSFPRDAVLRTAADAVVVGGLLLVTEHASSPSWISQPELHFPSVQEALGTIGLNPRQWETIFLGAPEREATEVAGQVGSIKDNIIALRRLMAEASNR